MEAHNLVVVSYLLVSYYTVLLGQTGGTKLALYYLVSEDLQDIFSKHENILAKIIIDESVAEYAIFSIKPRLQPLNTNMMRRGKKEKRK